MAKRIVVFSLLVFIGFIKTALADNAIVSYCYLADGPAGLFKNALGKKFVSPKISGALPAENMWLFDSMTFIDDDGQAYMYFGGNGENNLRVIKLNEDMISVDGAATSFKVPYFFEAAWMHKLNDKYYFLYSTNPKNGMRIDYMVSDHPISSFKYGGIVSSQLPHNNNNNHRAVFELNGKWYQAYHNRMVDINGKVIGKTTISDTGGVHIWKELQVNIDPVSGIRDVFIVFKGRETG